MDKPEEAAGHPKRLHLTRVAFAYALALCGAGTLALVLRGDPWLVALAADLVATLIVYAFSLLYDNSSVYDPYWSVAPIFIVLFWRARGGGGARVNLVFALVAAWGIRLTANWALRWRGLSDEDFRYRELRHRTGRAYWSVSFLAVHLLPTAWVFFGLWPLYGACSARARGLSPLDLGAALITAGAIVIESWADAQLRAFRRRQKEPGAVLEEGLWAACRHPNYLGEVLFWWGLYLFGIAARPDHAYTALGPLAITILFVTVSVPWMDRRMLAGHPGYAERMRTTPALFPWRVRRPR
ncbi:MAG TPA: DUF1295 domain-containing protein [Anaeromyxobacteraceae bacterium]|nr:DUF1295 domain-containing protein [Anaeromyxobacteraceae bacterium]